MLGEKKKVSETSPKIKKKTKSLINEAKKIKMNKKGNKKNQK